MIHVTAVHHVAEYKLALDFSDGTSGIADLSNELGRKAFAPIREFEAFRQAFIADGTVCWPGELDLAAERLFALAHGLTPPETLEQANENERRVTMRGPRSP